MSRRKIMSFNSRRLKEIRENLGISKAEAARRLNMTAMGYGRYENGQREPSFQTINYIAQVFGTSSDYLYDKVNNPSANCITIYKSDDPVLFDLIQTYQQNSDSAIRIANYYQKLKNNKKE
ncbi:MAG: helix-turn-helix transcriptional regulator [Butyrivibrio sp.]|nr:helix-turn-helix transcriptional regulator [Butyrivibrio sp.]